VNGDLALGKRQRVKPLVGAESEETNRESASPVRRERIGARPRVARDRHPAVLTSPKAVGGSRDRGCNGHRILRRALTDRRHPGSPRGVSRHGRAFRVVLAGPCILQPITNPSKEGVAVTSSTREGVWGVRVNRDSRQGCQRFDRHQYRGNKTPTLTLESVSRRGGRCADDDPPKRSSDVVKRPVPRYYRTEPKPPWGVPAAKVARGVGNARGASARSSFGWQISVGRIARLLHREVARPVGDTRGR